MGVKREGSEDVSGDASVNDVRKLVRELGRESEATAQNESPYPPDTVPAHRADTVVQSVRLNTSDLQKTKAISAKTGIPVGALLRSWIKEGLAAESSVSLDASIERLAAEVDRLRRVARGA